MKYYSTRDKNTSKSFHDALFNGLASDGGLFIPEKFKRFSHDIIEHCHQDTLQALGICLMQEFVSELPSDVLQKIIKNTLTFPIPLVPLEDNLFLLEVFHGPTLAFKDVGARFMANTLSYFLQQENKHLKIIVATSGDTGSAIANAFHLMTNIDVYVLYPSKKITFLQEQQMTTLHDNIHAIEVLGTFDDCQHLVKAALLDADIKKAGLITTANSINIARLLPQMIYHAHGLCELKKQNIQEAPILSVPSGNFGNLTSAIYAELLGFNVKHYIAATNINEIVPQYLKTGIFEPKPTKHSLSNAMDVGNPSNFERLRAIFDEYNHIQSKMTGISISDEETLDEIRETFERTNYILDPHTAVGVKAARKFNDKKTPIIITATAHPAKFPDVTKKAIGTTATTPKALLDALNGKKEATVLTPSLDALKKILI